MDCEYEKIVHIQKVLKPFYQATIVLQRTDFTMSDFYATWIQLESSLQKLVKKYPDGSLATSLLEAMAKRKPQLIENPTMTCALALDPRFCGDLNGERKTHAINQLLNLWRRVRSVLGENVVISDSSDSEMDISLQSTTILKRFNKQEQTCTQNQVSTNVFALSEKISDFMCHEHNMPEGTIFDFWAQNRDKFPELHYLSQVIFAICPTQAVVERAFSTLSYVFSIRRSRLNEHLLNDILTLSLNEDLFHQVNEDDCAEIMKNTK